jgi:oxaloacetate decarboxylase gamma subunit
MQNIASESTLLDQGIDMMLYGMGSVFVFLLALVVAISLLSRFIEKFFPEPLAPLVSIDPGASVATAVDPLTRKIVQAAIDQHRAS